MAWDGGCPRSVRASSTRRRSSISRERRRQKPHVPAVSVRVTPARLSFHFLTLLCILAAGCYDSRYFDMQSAKKAAEERARPAALQATPGGTAEREGARPTHAMKIRVRTTRRYRAEVPSFDRQIETMVADANGVLAPTLGIRLVVDSTEAWPLPAGDEDLQGALDQLKASDAGEGVDWVVGVLGSSTGLEMSFRKLGMTLHFGKHIVLRTPNEAAEHDVFAKTLDHLDAPEIEKLVRARKRHRAATILLHELGHSLGVPHELQAHTIMHFLYDTQVESYSEPATALMRATLASRRGDDCPEDWTKPLTAILEASPERWDPTDLEALEDVLRQTSARLTSTATPPPPPKVVAPAPFTREPPPPAPVSGLADADQLVFAEATADWKLGRFRVAFTKAELLAKRYPKVVEVLSLRCDIARTARFPEADRVCPRKRTAAK